MDDALIAAAKAAGFPVEKVEAMTDGISTPAEFRAALAGEPLLLTTAMLERLKDAAARAHLPVIEALRPGLAQAELDEAAATLPAGLPTEARVLWGWHDGAQVDGRIVGGNYWLNHPFWPLEEALRQFHLQREFAKNLAERGRGDSTNVAGQDWYWPPTWLPLTTGEYGTVALDCDVPTGSPSPVHNNDPNPDLDFHEVRVASLGQLVTWWAEALEGGAYSVDPRSGEWKFAPEFLPGGLVFSL